MTRELVVISGKGGTGKTSLVASFAVLSNSTVLADCDVDASDLHLVLAPDVCRRAVFKSGFEAVIAEDDCNGCGLCAEACRFEAIERLPDNSALFRVDPVACEGCGACELWCPTGAITLHERTCGEWYVSRSRAGWLVHARLDPGGENSGKLVTVVRREARRIAEDEGARLVLVDGPPGIGCPVIASITGASMVLAVTEPTLSGRHDLERVLQLASHFGVPAAVSVNKWDLNPEMTEEIEGFARERDAVLVTRVRYDPAFTAAQVEGKSLVEFDSGIAQDDVRETWSKLGALLSQ